MGRVEIRKQEIQFAAAWRGWNPQGSKGNSAQATSRSFNPWSQSFPDTFQCFFCLQISLDARCSEPPGNTTEYLSDLSDVIQFPESKFRALLIVLPPLIHPFKKHLQVTGMYQALGLHQSTKLTKSPGSQELTSKSPMMLLVQLMFNTMMLRGPGPSNRENCSKVLPFHLPPRCTVPSPL